MDSSLWGNIIEIRRLIEKFDDKGVDLFKKCVFNEVRCNNEKDWWIFIIKFFPQIVTHNSIAILRNTAIQIAESQTVSVNDDATNTPVTKSRKQHRNLNKWIREKYKDKLSHLPSDIINDIGSYLNKKESMTLGFLNRQLYIETQKESYLKRRYNDKTFELTDYLIDCISNKESKFKMFAYSMPTELRVAPISKKYPPHLGDVFSRKTTANRRLIAFSTNWFKTMFTRLNSFECAILSCLQFVPIELLFGVKKNNIHGRNNCNMIKCLEFSYNDFGNAPTVTDFGFVRSFCFRFSQFKKRVESIDTCYNCIKNVKLLRIKSIPCCSNYSGREWENLCANATKNLLMTFGPISENIELEECQFTINNHQVAMKKLFGQESCVKSIYVKGTFDGTIITSIRNKRNPSKNYDNPITETLNRCKLNTIMRNLNINDIRGGSTYRAMKSDGTFLQFLHDLDAYKVTANVNRYVLYCSENIHQELNPESPIDNTPEKEHLDDVLFDHNDERPLLKTFVVKVVDNCQFYSIANLFLYLMKNTEKLMNPIHCNIECIEIYVSTYRGWCSKTTPVPKFGAKKSCDSPALQIFNLVKNQDYDCQQQRIDFTLSKCNDLDHQLAIMYRNVVHWLKKVWKWKRKAHCIPEGCRVQMIKDRVISIEIER